MILVVIGFILGGRDDLAAGRVDCHIHDALALDHRITPSGHADIRVMVKIAIKN
jgi:predicted DNA-binding protein with PD1-like motif